MNAQANNVDKEKVRIIGCRMVEGLLKKISVKGANYRAVSKGEKRILRDIGPLIFTSGFMWTLDNVAVQDDPRCVELEKHLRNFVTHYRGGGVVADITALDEANNYLTQLDLERETQRHAEEKHKGNSEEENLLPNPLPGEERQEEQILQSGENTPEGSRCYSGDGGVVPPHCIPSPDRDEKATPFPEISA